MDMAGRSRKRNGDFGTAAVGAKPESVDREPELPLGRHKQSFDLDQEGDCSLGEPPPDAARLYGYNASEAVVLFLIFDQLSVRRTTA
jgi:hypothetical protein